MSKPVSNDEIEDVLSSIRRLVSENAGAIRRGPEQEKAPEKLVLTPAFRVDEETEAEAGHVSDFEAEAEEDDEVVAFDIGRRAANPAHAEAEAEAASVVVDEDHAEDEGEDETSHHEAPSEESIDAWFEKAEAQDATSEPDAPEHAEDETRTALERRIAELEAVIARSAVEFEPDGSEDDAATESFMFRHGGGEAAPAEAAEGASENGEEAYAAEEEHAAAEEAAEQVEAPEWSDEADEPVAEEDVAEEPEGAVEAQEVSADARPEDEAEDEEAYAAEEEAVQDWEDVDDGDETGQADDDTYGAEYDDDDGDYDDDDADTALLDEDTLREMVARMVREELQGTVGERITHNVRRMVRREIARALALQNFE